MKPYLPGTYTGTAGTGVFTSPTALLSEEEDEKIRHAELHAILGHHGDTYPHPSHSSKPGDEAPAFSVHSRARIEQMRRKEEDKISARLGGWRAGENRADQTT